MPLRYKLKSLLFGSLCLSLAALSACVSVPDTSACAVNGALSNGGTCVTTLSGVTRELSFQGMLDLLDAMPVAYTDPDTGMPVAAHGAAIIQSAADWNAQKTALEEACRELGNRCSYAVTQALDSMEKTESRFRQARNAQRGL